MTIKVKCKGEVLDGLEVKTVKATLAKLFKKDVVQFDPLFTGKTLVIKECRSLEDAHKVIGLFRKAGAIAFIDGDEQGREPLQDSDYAAVQEEYIPVPERPKRHEPDASAVPDRVLTAPKPAIKSVTSGLQASWQQRWKYRIDTFMAKGGSSSFKALTAAFLAIFFLIAALRGLLHVLSPETAQQYENLDFFGNIYITFLQLTDPGNMAQDILSSVWYKIFAVLAGMAGVVLLSALIAFITTALDQKLNELKRGHSKVIESNHTLILGWNEQRIVEIIRELVLANESEDDGCVVILADKDKEAMDDVLRLQIPSRLTTRIVTRSGRVSTLANLDMVSIDHARSVIILSTCDDTTTPAEKTKSDAAVIQTILAASGKTQNNEVSIVAEIFNDAYRDIIEGSFAAKVVIVNTSDILAKLLVQTSRSVGLSSVYSEILSFDGCEMYFYHADWRGERFGKLVYFFEDGVPIGVRQADGRLILNADFDYEMQDDDDIVIVADDDSTIQYQASPVLRAR